MDKTPLTPKQLHEALALAGQKNAELKVVVPYTPPFITVGATPCVEILGASLGFDWDHGKLFLHPSKPLGVAGQEYELARTRVNEMSSKLAQIASMLRREDLPAQERLDRAKALLPDQLRTPALRSVSGRRPAP